MSEKKIKMPLYLKESIALERELETLQKQVEELQEKLDTAVESLEKVQKVIPDFIIPWVTESRFVINEALKAIKDGK
jgi:hypothetical protein